MDLRAQLLALIAPTHIGDRLGGSTLVGASTELGLRLSFEVDGAYVHVEIAPASENAPHAARSRELTFAYRAGRDGERVDPELGLRLCERVAEVARVNETAVLAAIAAQAHGGAEKIREVEVERLCEPAEATSQPHYTVSPYVGCLIGCKFCYAQTPLARIRRLQQLAEVPWGSYVDVRVNAAEVLAQELEKLPPLPIKLCPIVSDPYQAVEKRYRITRACLEALAAGAPRPVLVLTRSALIERDIDLLARIPGARVGVSLPTIDDEVRARFEPRAASIPERLTVLSRMHEAGVRTFAVVQPQLPGSIDELADALAATGSSASLDVLRGEYEAGAAFDAYPEARDEPWQRGRLSALSAALLDRGVPVWPGELPEDV